MPSLNPHLSLYSRFILWQLAVLTPLLLAGLLHQQYLAPRFINQLNEIVEEITEEVLQVKSLQLALHRSAAPVNDYLIHGESREIENFERQRRQVDEIFTATRNAPFGDANERGQLKSAWENWEEAKPLANELIAGRNSVAMAELSTKMERFDLHIENASERLEILHNHAYDEIKKAQASAHTAKEESDRLSAAAVILALLLSILLGSILARSIISSLISLREGASQLAAGRFKQIVNVDGPGELRELAESFNVMAAKVHARDTVLQDEATRDALTGLENRRSLEKSLQEELHRAHRYQRPMGVLMLDIDHFKYVNDTYGHPAGDVVLQLLAGILRETVRPFDRVFRYGGEEFVIISPETTGNSALLIAERVREAVANKTFPLPGHRNIHITVSIGVATYPAIPNNEQGLLTEADKALYKAKESGRNRVCLYLSQTEKKEGE